MAATYVRCRWIIFCRSISLLSVDWDFLSILRYSDARELQQQNHLTQKKLTGAMRVGVMKSLLISVSSFLRLSVKMGLASLPELYLNRNKWVSRVELSANVENGLSMMRNPW